MKIEDLPTKVPNNGCQIETESIRNTIVRAIATLAIRFALASLKLWAPQRHPVEEEPERTETLNEARMAFATLQHQVNCQCTSCKCELIVTAFRLKLVSPNTNKD